MKDLVLCQQMSGSCSLGSAAVGSCKVLKGKGRPCIVLYILVGEQYLVKRNLDSIPLGMPRAAKRIRVIGPSLIPARFTQATFSCPFT